MTPLSATPTLAGADGPDVSAYTNESRLDPQSTLVHLDAWRATRAKLDEFAQLPDGWDGDDSASIDAHAVAMASRYARWLASRALPAPNVVPLADGGIQLEWWRGERRLEISFDADRDVVFVCDDPNLPGGLDGQLPQDAARLEAALIRTLTG